MNYYYLGVNFVVCCLTLYIFTKTKYLDFIINPSNKFYKHNFKTYINNHYVNQKNVEFIKKNIDKISQVKENIFERTKTNAIVLYKSVFYKLYFLIFLTVVLTVISYFYLKFNNLDIKQAAFFLCLTMVPLGLLYLIRFLCYCSIDVYFFSSKLSFVFSFFLAIAMGIYFGCLYYFYYIYISEELKAILKYFFVLFILLPCFLTFIIVFLLSFLYYHNKIKVNDKFHALLKKLFIISFFLGHIGYLKCLIIIFYGF